MRHVMISLTIAFVGAGCSARNDVPSESDARAAVEAEFAKSPHQPTLISLEKQDGQSAEIDGVKLYTLAFTAEAKNTKDSPGYQSPLSSEVDYYCKDGTETFTGKVEFEKSEKGWTARSFAGPLKTLFGVQHVPCSTKQATTDTEEAIGSD